MNLNSVPPTSHVYHEILSQSPSGLRLSCGHVVQMVVEKGAQLVGKRVPCTACTVAAERAR